MHPNDFLWFQNRISSLEQQLTQAQAEVERITAMIDRYDGTVMTIQELRQRLFLNPQPEAKDATA